MFNQEEKQALINLLDLAMKAGGLTVANDVMYFVKKLSTPEMPVAPPEPEQSKEPKAEVKMTNKGTKIKRK